MKSARARTDLSKEQQREENTVLTLHIGSLTTSEYMYIILLEALQVKILLNRK